MRTYVTSLSVNARYAHIGNAYWTACGYVFGRLFEVTGEPPEGVDVCPRCLRAVSVSLQEAARLGAAREAHDARQALEETRVAWDHYSRQHGIALRMDHRDTKIVLLLLRGKGNVDIAREMRWSLRATVRHIADAMHRTGAATRFQWGYLIGLEVGRTPRGDDT